MCMGRGETAKAAQKVSVARFGPGGQNLQIKKVSQGNINGSKDARARLLISSLIPHPPSRLTLPRSFSGKLKAHTS